MGFALYLTQRGQDGKGAETGVERAEAVGGERKAEGRAEGVER